MELRQSETGGQTQYEWEKWVSVQRKSGQEQNTSFRQMQGNKQGRASSQWDKWTCPYDSTIWNDRGSLGRAICLLSWL